MELIRPRRQETWGWAAALNFILGGMGAGFYLLSLLLLNLPVETAGRQQPSAVLTAAPILVLLGLAVLALEAGRPLRSRYLLSHLRNSWMSRETLAALLFVPCALLDAFFPILLLRLIAAAAAIAFILSQSFLVYRARGIEGWNNPLLPLLFVASGFATGSGPLLLAAAWEGTVPARHAGWTALICLVLDLAVWLLYLRHCRNGGASRSVQALCRPRSLLLTVGVAHLLPMALLLPLIILPGKLAAWPVLAVAGWAVIIGGAGLKGAILLKAGYLREIVLDPRQEISCQQTRSGEGGGK
jgi:phenylacetyl-CoA:acceptor oxidoreductase subunit 2